MPWLACKPFGDIHSICPWANTPILVHLLYASHKLIMITTIGGHISLWDENMRFWQIYLNNMCKKKLIASKLCQLYI